MRHPIPVALLLATVCVADAAAHDFWIEPSTHRRDGAGAVTFALRVGERFAGDPVPRDAAKLEAFVVVGPDGTRRDVPGREGDDPAGRVRLEGEGLHVVGYRSRRRAITLSAAAFEAYLVEEGLEHVAKARADAHASGRDGAEVYSRAVKTYVRVGAAPASAGFDRPLGFDFELVPERDPLALAPGETLGVRALRDGKPAANVRIGAIRRGEARDATQVRTGADGRAELRLDRAGAWLVRAVHMRPAPAGTNADWESVWASLTFDVLLPPTPGAPAK